MMMDKGQRLYISALRIASWLLDEGDPVRAARMAGALALLALGTGLENPALISRLTTLAENLAKSSSREEES